MNADEIRALIPKTCDLLNIKNPLTEPLKIGVPIIPIRHKCKKCGACCKNIKLSIFKHEIKRMAEFLKMSEKEFMEKHISEEKLMTRSIFKNHKILKHLIVEGYRLNKEKDGNCPFLNKQNTCEIYEVRPHKCRQFPYNNPCLDGNHIICGIGTIDECDGLEKDDSVLTDTEYLQAIGMTMMNGLFFELDEIGHKLFLKKLGAKK